LNGTAELSAAARSPDWRRAALRRIERKPLSGGGDFRIGKTPYETLTVSSTSSTALPMPMTWRMEPAVGSAVRRDPAREVDLRGTASLLSTSGPVALRVAAFMVKWRGTIRSWLPDPKAGCSARRSGAALTRCAGAATDRPSA
jgi:AsmA protein